MDLVDREREDREAVGQERPGPEPVEEPEIRAQDVPGDAELPSSEPVWEGETGELPEAEPARLQERIRALEEELAARTREVEEYVHHLQRLQAEFANYRKRVRREQEEAGERAVEELLRQLLPVVDNLERAIAAASQDGANLESLRTGVVMVHRQLGELLFKEGASPMNCSGEEFDPAKHHAVAVVETEEQEENTVVDELQKGYFFRGRVLRPALVRVARRPQKEEKVIPLRPEEGESNG